MIHSLFYSFAYSCCLLIKNANSFDSDQAWIQTVLHSDGNPERIFFEKIDFEKKISR